MIIMIKKIDANLVITDVSDKTKKNKIMDQYTAKMVDSKDIEDITIKFLMFPSEGLQMRSKIKIKVEISADTQKQLPDMDVMNEVFGAESDDMELESESKSK